MEREEGEKNDSRARLRGISQKERLFLAKNAKKYLMGGKWKNEKNHFTGNQAHFVKN
jgi:hypothetical protein